METRTGKDVRLPNETRTFSKGEARQKLQEGWRLLQVNGDDTVTMIYEGVSGDVSIRRG